MIGFGDNTPPSIRKMEMGGNRYGSKPSFSMSNIAGDPFWLGTIGIAAVSTRVGVRMERRKISNVK